MIFGAIGGLCVALVTIFKKHLATYTTLIYAALEGLFLGGISQYYAQQFDGIVGQAIFLTFAIFVALLFAYKTKLIAPTENFIEALEVEVCSLYKINTLVRIL